jgi:hypothetical protein
MGPHRVKRAVTNKSPKSHFSIMTRRRDRRYRSDVQNDWPYTGAFVLQLCPGTDVAAGRLEGRLEHVASTRSARFGSLDELLAALADMLADAGRSEKKSFPVSHPPEPPLGGAGP